MRFTNILRNNSFANSLKLTISNPKKAGLIILLDALFAVSVYVLFQLMFYFAQGIVIHKSINTLPSMLVILTFLVIGLLYLAYYMLLLFVYSFFKFTVLHSLKLLIESDEAGKPEKEEFSFKGLNQFYLLNIAIAVIFSAMFILLFFALESLKEPYKPSAFIAMAVPYLLALYLAVNILDAVWHKN